MADIRVKILVFQHDGTIVSQYLLGEGVHVIGRDPNSAIYVESEYISNEHAKLHLTDEGIFIEDLNSTSGTFLDDVTVRGKLRLNPDQRLKVGDLYIDLQLEAAGDLAPGVKIGAGRYQLVKELGRGAMGQVWLGQDTQLDEHVAIKVLNSDVAKDAVSLLDLKREVQKSRKLSHDNIIRIHDLVQLPGENPFISLEYVEGTDLHAIQLNQPDRIFQWAEVKPYVLQLCEALDYAHERKIVHRDLKPPNIMIAKDGVLKLADFGIAASIVDATGRSSMANIISGTPQFMSPQQMLGKSPKASDDIYALGATIYDLLTGRPPFHTGDIAQQVHHVTPAPLEQRLAEFGLQNSVPDYVNSVVLSCLAKDPEARPTSAGAIAEWIRTEGKSDSPAKRKKTKTGVEKITPEEPIQVEAETPAPVEAQPQEAKGKKSPVLAIAAVAVIAVIAGVLSLGKSGGKDENQNQGDDPQAGGERATEGQPAIATQMQAKLKEGLVAYYPFNGNAKDESGNGNDGEVKGADLTTDRFGNSGTAYSFDGNGAKIVLPAFKYGQRFTVSIWVNSHSTDGSTFLSKKPSYHVDSLSFGDSKVGGGTYTAIVYSGNDTHVSRSAPNPGPITREWSHLIFSYDGGQSHSSIRIYKDGIQIDDTDIPSEKGTFTVFNDLEVKTEIGSQNSNTEPKTTFLGKLDDVRIYNRVLSANEIMALYDLEKPDYTKILKQGLVAYYPFNGNANDESGNGLDGEVKGPTLTTDRNGKKASAYNFDGKSWIDLPQRKNLKFGANDFTYSAWIQTEKEKFNNTHGGWVVAEDRNNDNGGRNLGISDQNGRLVSFRVSDAKKLKGPEYHVHVKTPNTIADSQWHQIIGIRRGDQFILAIDGREVAREENKIIENSDAGNIQVRIGARAAWNQFITAFFGSIDDVRIYDRALSDGEITALYDLEKPSSETASGTKKPGTLLWEFETGDKVISSPAIGSDGTVYVGSYDKKVYALDGKTGTKKWEFEVGDWVHSSPAIGADGTIYFGTQKTSGVGRVCAVDGKTDAKKWEFKTKGDVMSSPAIGADGAVYVGSEGNKVHALDGKTGIKKWEFGARWAVHSSPAIGADGTIYVGSGEDKKVYALDGKTGIRIWGFGAGNRVTASPSIGSDGTVYVGSTNAKVYALDGKTGAKKWEFETGGQASSPAIGADGTVYVGSNDRKLYALDGKTGAKKWEFLTEGYVPSTPAIGSDGTVYVGSMDKKIYALDGVTGAKQWEFETGDQVYSSPAIGADGTIYIGSYDGKVYALATSSKGPAKSPWPMFGQNAQHTGRASASKTSSASTHGARVAAATEAAIRKAVGKPTGELTKADLEKATKLELIGAGSSDLEALAGLTNLRELLLHYNRFTDVNTLMKFTNLELLQIHNNQITDVSGLAKLTKLKRLFLNANPLTNISPLAGLTNLELLLLDGTQIHDLTPLSGLKQLKDLGLKNSAYISKAKIARLQKALPNCKIHHNAGLGIPNSPEVEAAIEAAIRKAAGKPTGQLTVQDYLKVEALDLNRKQLTDVSELRGLTNLKSINLYGNPITDVSPLAGLTKLEELQLGYCQVTNLKPLMGLKLLKDLNLLNNKGLTKTEVDAMRKVLPPGCILFENATK